MMPPTAGQTERFFLQRQQHRMPRTSSHHGITPGQQPLWKDRLRHKNGTVNTRHELQPRRYPLAQGDEPSAWTHKRWERDPMPRSAPLHHPSSHPTAPDVCVHPKLTTPPNQLSKRKKKHKRDFPPYKALLRQPQPPQALPFPQFQLSRRIGPILPSVVAGRLVLPSRAGPAEMVSADAPPDNPPGDFDSIDASTGIVRWSEPD
jgi:hypothetical protein